MNISILLVQAHFLPREHSEATAWETPRLAGKDASQDPMRHLPLEALASSLPPPWHSSTCSSPLPSLEGLACPLCPCRAQSSLKAHFKNRQLGSSFIHLFTLILSYLPTVCIKRLPHARPVWCKG